MIRKLASIRQIKEILPIPASDNLELAIVDGWQVVIRKGEFKAGDKVIYCEIDSFLPIRPEFEFLRPSSYRVMADGSDGFRLKTVRLRGQLSQGLLINPEPFGLSGMDMGAEVTEALGIRKYEAPVPACLDGDAKGVLPGFLQSTDQERIQNLTAYFDRFKQMEFESTEKLDGTSMSVYFNNGEYGICGHTYEYLDTPRNTYWIVAKRMEIQQKLSGYGRNIALQMELIGENIQKNKYRVRGQTARIYDIWDIDHQYYLTSSERLQAVTDLGLGDFHVPVLGTVKIFTVCPDINSILAYVEGKSVLSDIEREGIVFKSMERVGPEVISFKTINNNFKE